MTSWNLRVKVHIWANFAEVLRRRAISLVGALAAAYLGSIGVLFAIGRVIRTIIDWSGALHPFDPREMWNSFGPLPKLGVVLAFCLWAGATYAVGVAGVTLITWEDRQGKTPTLREVAVSIGPLLPRLIVLGFFISVGSVFGSFVFVIPGIVFVAFTAFAVAALVIEKMNVLKALSRSVRLTKPEIFAIGAVYLLFGLLYSILQFPLVLVLARSLALGLSMLFIVMLVVGACHGVLITLFYCQARSTLNEHPPGLVES